MGGDITGNEGTVKSGVAKLSAMARLATSSEASRLVCKNGRLYRHSINFRTEVWW